jgi:hypothetical protein
MTDFWEVYRTGSPAAFHLAWEHLLADWPGARDYLQKGIYPDHQRWSWAYVGPRFTCGLRTTGRVEVEHKNYKLLGLGPKSTLNEVFDKLNARSEEQQDQSQAAALKVFWDSSYGTHDRHNESNIPIQNCSKDSFSRYWRNADSF